jgi:Kelch motif
MDDVPTPTGFTHSAYVIVGNTLYTCGGYIGGNPGHESDVCLKYDHTAMKGQQWSSLPSLPSGRAGGAMLYIKTTNTLLVATGATRSDPLDIWHSTDYNTVWELSLTDTSTGWVQKADIPHKGNHVAYTTVNHLGTDRHYVFGGQLHEDEAYGNQKELYEYDGVQWIRRADMPYGRGHTSSSTFPVGSCGFITAGGAINGKMKTSDIHYYSIVTDTWTKIGNLPAKINTPICDLVDLEDGKYIYCQTGFIRPRFSFRRKIEV